MTAHGRPELTPELIERFTAYGTDGWNWKSLHIVLDDGNYEDHSVKWCIEYARERGDTEGESLARILLTLSKSQRGRIDRKVRSTAPARELRAYTEVYGPDQDR